MALPVVTGITPSSGPNAGGTIVTITGEGLTGAIAVGFGETDATNIAVVSDTQVIAVSPPGAGSQTVSVSTPQGRSAVSATVWFTYAAPRLAGDGSPFEIDPALASGINGGVIDFKSAAARSQRSRPRAVQTNRSTSMLSRVWEGMTFA